MMLFSVSLILITTGCEVQKVGNTPTQDFVIQDVPGTPNETDYTEAEELGETEFEGAVGDIDTTTALPEYTPPSIVIEDLPTLPGAADLEPIPDAPPPPAAITAPDLTPPPSEEPVDAAGTETVAAIVDPADPVAEAAAVLLVADEDNAAAVAAVEADVIALVQEAVPDAVPIEAGVTPAQIAEVADGFQQAVQDSIEAGVGVPAVDTAAVNTVLEAIEEDSTLSSLLAAFLGSDNSLLSVPNFINLPDIDELNRIYSYEECVVSCADSAVVLCNSLEDLAATNTANCTGIADENFSSCSAPVQQDYNSCTADNSEQLGDCYDQVGSLSAACQETANTNAGTCNTNLSQAKNDCDEAWGVTYTACSDSLLADDTECRQRISDVADTEQAGCIADVGVQYNDCLAEVTLESGNCSDNANIILTQGLDAASQAFEDLMINVVTMLESADPTEQNLGATLESMGWTLYMNQCFTANEIYTYETSVCADTLSSWQQGCEDDKTEYESNCNFEAAYEECDEARDANESQCLNIQTEGSAACIDTYGENPAAVCEDIRAAALEACDQNYGADSEGVSLCLNTYAVNDSTCQAFFDDGVGTQDNPGYCYTEYLDQLGFCDDDAGVDYTQCEQYETDCVQECHNSQGGG